MEAAAAFAFLIAVVPACGIAMAATPWLTPKRECFGVTVPPSAQNDAQIRAIKRRFAIRCLIVSAIAGAVTAGVGAQAQSHADAFTATLVAATLSCTLIPFAFMLKARKQVMAIKRKRDWQAEQRMAAAVIVEGDMPHAIPLVWNLLYLPVALIVIAIGIIAYPSMPDTIPMHADFAGNVNRFAPKSIGVVFGFPVGLVAFMAAAFTFSHWAMTCSKRPSDPNAPAASALAYGLFARAQSIFLLVTGLCLTSAIGIGFMLSSAGVMTLDQCGAVIAIACIPVLVGSIALSLVYGQSGSRLLRRMQTRSEDDSMPADDDAHWKLGVFYCNPDDPSIWLPERFGVGWTLNFGRPAAWACIVGPSALTIALAVACMTLAG